MEESSEVSQWRDSEVIDLVTIWGDSSTQAKLKECYCNRSVFESLVLQMAQWDHYRMWLQCQQKVKSIKAKFKQAKDFCFIAFINLG